MSNLHALFALRNEEAFSRTLDASRSQGSTQQPLSSSAGRSWSRSHIPPTDINARDWLGRTILHIACSVPDPFAIKCVRLLLAHPAINVNIQDVESRWTPLHRALYAGNISVVILLLQRTDIDVNLRDHDGYTPFDLYNSTVNATSLSENLANDWSADLFTWGVNRNATLGHGDANDRSFPDQVPILPPTPTSETSSSRFTPIRVNGISMAKLHTLVITNEPRGNLRVCGLGHGGRLGTGEHIQYDLQPVPKLTSHVIAAALGQDHTLAVTDAGEVLSWGLNRFSQLGYAVEREDFVQTVPRRVIGPLRRERVIGVAACRSASACWTINDVFTWGVNNGQLGYDCATQPVQVLPRKVTGVQAVIEIALTESAMACLADTMEVICFRADAHFRVKFPSPDPLSLPHFQRLNRPEKITKITSTDGFFAALSSRGDIFVFDAPPPASQVDHRPAIKPQRAWPIRKSFDPAKDVAVGADGTLIICTASGHVFLRRPSAKTVRIPFVHQVVQVCANGTGAFAVLQRPPAPPLVHVIGSTLVEDICSIRPWMLGGRGNGSTAAVSNVIDADDDEDNSALCADVAMITELCAFLWSGETRPRCHGSDVLIDAGVIIPAHRAILAARSPALRTLFQGSVNSISSGSVKLTYFSNKDGGRLTVTGCLSITVLLVLEYMYTDRIPAPWDSRIHRLCSDILVRIGAEPGTMKTQLENLAATLELPALRACLCVPTKRLPVPTLAQDLSRLVREYVSPPDVLLEFADHAVECHAVLLHARSQFFRGLFDDGDWTARRWPAGELLVMDMKHMKWRAVAFAMEWICCGEEAELFEHIEDVKSVSELLDLVLDVMAVASELLLDRLMLICSSIILRHITLQNVLPLLEEATYYNALELVDSLQLFVAMNMESICESHLLDKAQPDLIDAVGVAVRKRQTDTAPVTRKNILGESLLHEYSTWLETQDIPQPLVRNQRPYEESPNLSPTGLDKASPRRGFSKAGGSSSMKYSVPKAAQEDEIFSMEDEPVPPLNIGQPRSFSNEYTSSAWKLESIRVPGPVSMKTIMTETEMETRRAGGSGGSGSPEHSSQWTRKAPQRESYKVRETGVQGQHSSTGTKSGWKQSDQQKSTGASSIPGVKSRSSPSNKISKGQPATPALVLQGSNFVGGSSPAVQRKLSSDVPAWTKAPVHDASPVAASSLSFADIQKQQERDQRQQRPARQSLKDIQREEEARKEEEEFLRWWAAEEDRLRAEAEGQVQRAETSKLGAVESRREKGRRRRRREDV